MPCPKATHGAHRVYINFLLKRPSWKKARSSKVLREHLNRHNYLTPNFSEREMADSETGHLVNRTNSIRHCWNLELFAAEMGKHRRRGHKGARVSIKIDGPSRTKAHNSRIGGASDSRHTHGDASDHFVSQVQHWRLSTGLALHEILAISYKIFGGVGNETSGTLHLDSRPHPKGVVAKFVTW